MDLLSARTAAKRAAPRPADVAPELPAWTPECDALVDDVATRLRRDLRDRKPEADPPPEGGRVLCMMMIRDDAELIDPWLRYHARLFGPGRLVVLDNGSTHPAVRERLARAREEGVHVVWDFDQRAHFEHKGRLFCRLLRGIEADLDHDFFMPLDSDEFVAARDPDGRVHCSRDGVARHLRRHLRDPNILFIAGSFFSMPGQPGMYYWNQEAKCFFAAGAAGSLHMGFHWGAARDATGRTDTSIVHFHYRFRSHRLYIDSAKRKLESRIAGFTPEELADPSRTRNGHVGRLAILGDQDYLASFSKRVDRFPLSALDDALRSLGSPMAF